MTLLLSKAETEYFRRKRAKAHTYLAKLPRNGYVFPIPTTVSHDRSFGVGEYELRELATYIKERVDRLPDVYYTDQGVDGPIGSVHKATDLSKIISGYLNEVVLGFATASARHRDALISRIILEIQTI